MERPSITNAYDGNIHTWTYSTAPWCEHSPFYVGIVFPRTTAVSGLRVWKKHRHGANHDCGTKSISVVYGSEAPGTPMDERSFIKVHTLTSGFEGREKWVAAQVMSDGLILRDAHDSETKGWASVSFDTVNATVIALQVDAQSDYNHLCLGEIHAFQDRDATLLAGKVQLNDKISKEL